MQTVPINGNRLFNPGYFCTGFPVLTNYTYINRTYQECLQNEFSMWLIMQVHSTWGNALMPHTHSDTDPFLGVDHPGSVGSSHHLPLLLLPDWMCHRAKKVMGR